MTLSTLKIGRREFVVVPRKDFERLQRKAGLLSDEDAQDVAESIRRLNDPCEKRIPWEQVKKHAGLV
jgi:PHD/YefM family antitoxin component YafN of YafNO toxin-antitoxin module